MKKRIKDLANKPVCEITFDDIIDLQSELERLIELERRLRKNATREKAKMLDKYIKRFYIPEKRWRDVHYVIESNERWASMYRDSLKDGPQSDGAECPACEEGIKR